MIPLWGGVIQKTIKKTRTFSRIPLNKFARAILEKYTETAHEPLPKISDQKFNKYLKKEVCKLAGIDTPTTITKFVGGKVFESTVPKYELITSHTARKTFTTNSLIFGMSESVVKKITGHKKDHSFRRYVNLAESFVKDDMNKAWDK